MSGTANLFERDDKNQNLLINTMPGRDRIKALVELSGYNIDHFTLFQTEDSLVKAMTLKEFELRVHITMLLQPAPKRRNLRAPLCK